jgi:uncharacterized lipoprotein YddW (UPF0748 family)
VPNLKKRAFALAGVLSLGALLASCSTNKPKPAAPAAPTAGPARPNPAVVRGGAMPPAAPREFRAAWVSTVANIDWPSRPNLTADKQQQEAIAILDRARALNLNAIVLQVRPAADAIYASNIEPWSEYLTNTQGLPPRPYYDPLQFWIKEAHARGLELHAWFNPYRARQTVGKPTAANHISRTHPNVVKTYGKLQWMDPGEETASNQTLDVVLDVVRRYDIDGVHVDDYFYPYPIDATGTDPGALDGRNGKQELDFPDWASWQRYTASGGKLDRASWRRQNVNRLIEAMYTGIHREKSWVRFGISPFGVGRPDRRPPGIVGFSQYDKLYADVELWLDNGWLDYLTPQLYWPIAQKPQAYGTLLDYWLAQNRRGRHVWPGLYTSRIGQPANDYQPQEIVDQIDVTRTRPAAGGHVHFSMAALMANRKGIYDRLRTASYTGQALVPATPWLGGTVPGVPVVQAGHAGGTTQLKLTAGSNNALYAVWARYGDEWRFSVVPAERVDWSLADDPRLGAANAVVVSAIDRLGNESARLKVL